MKKFILALSFLFFLTGCWDRFELEDLTIVSGIGIDQTDNKQYKVYFQIVNPEATGGGPGSGGAGAQKKPTLSISSTGRTVGEAIEKISHASPHRLFWGQTKVVIFGKKISEEGLKKAMDWVERVYGLRFNTLIYNTKEDIGKLFSGSFQLEKTPLFSMQNTNRIQTKDIVAFTPSLGKFVNYMQSENRVSYTGELGLKGKDIIFKGIGLYQDGKFIRTLNYNQMMDFMRLSNAVHGGTVTIPCKNKANSFTTFRVEKENTTYTVDMEDGIPRFEFKIKATGLIESTQCGKKLTEKELVNLEKQLNKMIEKRVQSIINIAQKELKIDFIGFNEKFKNKKFTQWKDIEKDWKRIFPKIQTRIIVHSSIKRVGLTTDPILSSDK